MHLSLLPHRALVRWWTRPKNIRSNSGMPCAHRPERRSMWVDFRRFPVEEAADSFSVCITFKAQTMHKNFRSEKTCKNNVVTQVCDKISSHFVVNTVNTLWKCKFKNNIKLFLLIKLWSTMNQFDTFRLTVSTFASCTAVTKFELFFVQGVHALQKAKFSSAVIDSVTSSYNRCIELKK